MEKAVSGGAAGSDSPDSFADVLMHSRVVAVATSASHTFSKDLVPSITLLAGLGVEGDAHAGVTVRHVSRLARGADLPNNRQVHLIPSELFVELARKGFTVAPGELGENVTTAGLALETLPVDTEIGLGPTAVVRLTGLRNPCAQIDRFQAGLMKAVLDRAPDGSLLRKVGVMAIVITGGIVRSGDAITVRLPAPPHRAMEPV